VRRHAIAFALAAAAATSLPVGLAAAGAATRTSGIPSSFASAIKLDVVNKTVTLPAFRGTAPGRGDTWFILTESSDFNDAVRRGINWAPKLKNALGTAAVQSATIDAKSTATSRDFTQGSKVRFSAGVDFSGIRVVIPGPTFFPPAPGTHAGPVGDPGYTPLFTFGDGIVYNGAQVANDTGHHGKLLALDTQHRTATIRMTAGFYLGRDVRYISTDASDTVVAALENAVFAPSLAAAPTAGNDDPAVSAREPIIPIVNGQLGVDNPQRQGLQSAVAGEGDPLNIIREEPECSDPTDPANCSALEYSPLWDAHPVVWTDAAIAAGLRVRVTNHETVEQLFNQGELVNANPTGPENHDPEIDGLRALGVVINCPPMFVAPA
jgi:hypothetical protein